MAKKTPVAETDPTDINPVLLMLDPASIVAEENTRYSLKRPQIDALKASIVEAGEVLEPVEVEPADENGIHSLTSGFYRHQALTELNKEGAGLKLPAIVRAVDPLTRLKHQLAENMARENQSPMDKAVAIKALMDAGIERAEIRRIFASAGGRKGNQVQPMSNALMNIHLNFLLLPKTMQEKIHAGLVGVGAAYELGKVSPDKRADVLERAEVERQKQLDQEEKDEAKYLSQESKLIEARAKADESAKAVDTLKAEIEAAAAMVEEKTKVLREVQKAPLGDGRGFLELTEDEKKPVTEKLKAAENDVKAAQKLTKDSKNKLAKALENAKSAEEKAADQAVKLEAARKAKKSTKSKAVSAAGVKKAAVAVGDSNGHVPLGLADIKSALKELQGEQVPAKVKLIAGCIRRCFDGVTTPKELADELALITGERKPPVKPVPAVKA